MSALSSSKSAEMSFSLLSRGLVSRRMSEKLYSTSLTPRVDALYRPSSRLWQRRQTSSFAGNNVAYLAVVSVGRGQLRSRVGNIYSLSKSKSECRRWMSSVSSEAALVKTTRKSRRWTWWKFVLAPYAVLSLIPITTTVLATYNYLAGKKEYARGYAFFSVTGWLCLPLSVPVLLSSPVIYLTDWGQRRFYNSIAKFWARTTTSPFFVPVIEGRENLPTKDKAAIIIANHESWTDIYSMFWMDTPISFVAKRSVFYIPVVGWLMGLLGHIALDRSSAGSRRDVLKNCRERLRNGAHIVFFPEGSRTRDGTLGQFKTGAFRLALEEDVPIVLVSIVGTGQLMPPDDEFYLGEGTPTLRVHPPLLPRDVVQQELSRTQPRRGQQKDPELSSLRPSEPKTTGEGQSAERAQEKVKLLRDYCRRQLEAALKEQRESAPRHTVAT